MNTTHFQDDMKKIEQEEIERRKLINRLLQAIVNILSFVGRIVRGRRN